MPGTKLVSGHKVVSEGDIAAGTQKVFLKGLAKFWGCYTTKQALCIHSYIYSTSMYREPPM